MDFQGIYSQARAAVEALLDEDRPHFDPVRLLVVGCSSSEIMGGLIGHASAPDAGAAVARAAIDVCRARGVRVAFQCCEHLNRALVTERETAEALSLEKVCVVPQVKAGGSCATAAYALFSDPVVVERAQAEAAIDIGGTLIGMHLRPVAVPIRLKTDRVGSAPVTAARTRPKLIGGERAKYE